MSGESGAFGGSGATMASRYLLVMPSRQDRSQAGASVEATAPEPELAGAGDAPAASSGETHGDTAKRTMKDEIAARLMRDSLRGFIFGPLEVDRVRRIVLCIPAKT